MDDENRRLEVDIRLRALLSPPGHVVDRVVMLALADNDHPPQHRRRMGLVVLTAVAVVLIALAVWQGRKRAGAENLPTSLAIAGERSMLVVESQDGHRWLVGPAPTRRVGGGYVIAIPQ